MDGNTLSPADVMLMTKQHCNRGMAATGVGLAAGLGGGALLLAIGLGYGVFVELVWDVYNMVEPQIYRTMAKSKQKEESAPIGQRLIFTNVNRVYQPLPRFESGCKNC